MRFCRRRGACGPHRLRRDIIAGFPTETEAMFCRSLELIEACGIVHLHASVLAPSRHRRRAHAAVAGAGGPRRARPAAPGRRGRPFAGFLHVEVGATRRALMERGGIARTEQFAPVRPDRPLEPGTIFSVALTAMTAGPGRTPVAAPAAAALEPVFAR